MINYLKESTFAVKDVIMQAWKVTRDNYFSIATFCFMLFITFSTSTFLAFFMGQLHIGVRIVMLLIFVILYCIVHLSLLKYIFRVLDHQGDSLMIVDTLPTRNEIIRFLIGTFYFGLSIFFVGIVLFPILFILDFVLRFAVSQGWVQNFNQFGDVIVKIAVAIAIISIFCTFIRIVFFPFFIIDKQAKPFESIRLSLATTRGNFIKLLAILGALALIQVVVFGFFYWTLSGFNLISMFFNYDINSYVSLLAAIFSSFVVVPFTTSLFSVAYRKIIKEYKGEEDPDILHNII